MAQRDYIVSINLSNQELLNAVMQNLGTHPTGVPEGFFYYNTANERAWTYSPLHPDADGSGWVDMTNIYTHPNNTGGAYNPTLSGANVLASINVDAQGHIDTLTTRIMTLTELGHPEANTPIDVDTTGATIVDEIHVNALGHVTSVGTRPLTNADIKSLIINDAVTNANYGWSSTKIASEIALAVTSGMTYKGDYNAATDTPSLDDGSPVPVSIGDTYTVATGGSFFTELVEPGDTLIAKQDSATTLAHWTVVQNNIDYATETVPGYIQLATQLEADAGSNDTKAITPLKLKTYVEAYVPTQTRTDEEIEDVAGAMVTGNTETNITVTYDDGTGKLNFNVPPASTTTKGVIEIATQTEANALSLTDRAITPGTIPIASTTQKGLAERATQTEVNTGTDDERFVTPLTLQTKLNAFDVSDTYTEVVGDAILQIFLIQHNLNSLNVTIYVRDDNTGKWMGTQEQVVDANNIEIRTNTIPTLNQLRVTVQK
jgi:hypothetical protein